MYGELIPEGGGDPIPLVKPNLVIGRRESCDIVLRFANVSGQHCQLNLEQGYWYVMDMNSQNGVKVNGMRVAQKLLENGDLLTISKHRYKIFYSPMECGASGPPPAEGNELINIMSKTLMERAGLAPKKKPVPGSPYGAPPAKEPPDKMNTVRVKTYEDEYKGDEE
jgi:adenylate cyclase